MATGEEKTNYGKEEPAEIRERITPLAEELSERLAAINPDLVVTLCSRKNAPARLRREGEETDSFTVTFRDFDNGAKFTNAFAKAGNGFINIHD